jgi:MerR family transcriptional regulator, copper efflux regulator
VDGGLMRIGEVAAAARVSTRTVDYYTSLGLIAAAERTSGNFRLYRPQTVGRIGAVRQLEASGAKLEDIVAALAAAPLTAAPRTGRPAKTPARVKGKAGTSAKAKAGGVSAAGAAATGAASLADALRQVDSDLHQLQSAVGDAGSDAIGLLTALTARIHSLVTTALELTGGIPPTP